VLSKAPCAKRLVQRFVQALGGVVPEHPLLKTKLRQSRRFALGAAESPAT